MSIGFKCRGPKVDHHHSFITHYALIYNTAKRNNKEELHEKWSVKIHDINNCQVKQKVANIVCWAAMGPPVHATFLFAILPIAEEMNLFTTLTVAWSKGRWRPPIAIESFVLCQNYWKNAIFASRQMGYRLLLFGSGLTKEIHDYL